MKVCVEWDFEDTHVQLVPYEDALRMSGLPETVMIRVDIAYESNEDITNWISEEYGFSLISWYEV